MNIHWSETVSAGKTENHNNILYTQINEIASWKGKNLGSIFFSNKAEGRIEKSSMICILELLSKII